MYTWLRGDILMHKRSLYISMTNTNPIICTFFLRDGFCAKGNYCTFAHDKTRQKQCKHFAQGNCKHGNACSFQHSQRKEVGGSAVKGVTVGRSSSSSSSTTTTTSSIQLPPSTTAEAVGPSTAATPKVESLWGFDDVEDAGVYFYGAPGTKIHSEQRTQLGSYRQVLGSHGGIGDGEIPHHVAIKPKKDICKFYASGNCKFGSACCYEHIMDEVCHAHSNEIYGEIPRTECGICLAPPDAGGLYGLMSHCNCVFCLKCIRNWRSEGIEVAHKSEQVRMCPLCRTESHFVVPSIRVVSGENKERVIGSYKQSLASRPCMHFQQDGVCPFGTSCFYMHVNRDGRVDEPTGPRIVIKDDSTTEICPTTKLSDFLRTAKRR